MQFFLTHRFVGPCGVTALSWSAAQAAEANFLERFRGSWSGSGKIQREGTSQPRQVTCSVASSPAGIGSVRRAVAVPLQSSAGKSALIWPMTPALAPATGSTPAPKLALPGSQAGAEVMW